MKDGYPKDNTFSFHDKCGPMTNISKIIQHQDEYDHNRETIGARLSEDWAAHHRNNFYNSWKKKTISPRSSSLPGGPNHSGSTYSAKPINDWLSDPLGLAQVIKPNKDHTISNSVRSDP